MALGKLPNVQHSKPIGVACGLIQDFSHDIIKSITKAIAIKSYRARDGKVFGEQIAAVNRAVDRRNLWNFDDCTTRHSALGLLEVARISLAGESSVLTKDVPTLVSFFSLECDANCVLTRTVKSPRVILAHEMIDTLLLREAKTRQRI